MKLVRFGPIGAGKPDVLDSARRPMGSTKMLWRGELESDFEKITT
jgi:hypothetical protein